jgi:hypothetical protein
VQYPTWIQTLDQKLISFLRLKQAAADPSSLTQEAIIENLNDAERGRLARIRNIGIAVCGNMSF